MLKARDDNREIVWGDKALQCGGPSLQQAQGAFRGQEVPPALEAALKERLGEPLIFAGYFARRSLVYCFLNLGFARVYLLMR